MIHSKDDDSIAYEQGVEIAKDLNAKLITYKNSSHFYKPENSETILEELRKELEF